MEPQQLFHYIESIVDDKFAMKELYIHLIQNMVHNHYSLNNVCKIHIKRDGDEELYIDIDNQYRTGIESFCILLSVRALILNKEWIKCCHPYYLLFTPSSTKKGRWIERLPFINQCRSDDEFKVIYRIFKYISTQGKLSSCKEKSIKKALSFLKSIAKTNANKTKTVPLTDTSKATISNNAHVCDEALTCYDIPSSICHIGDTAFAYCSNLTTIQFHNNQTTFGKFPIIECPKLSRIIVPQGTATYYKNALPYYKEIIIEATPFIPSKS